MAQRASVHQERLVILSREDLVVQTSALQTVHVLNRKYVSTDVASNDAMEWFVESVLPATMLQENVSANHSLSVIQKCFVCHLLQRLVVVLTADKTLIVSMELCRTVASATQAQPEIRMVSANQSQETVAVR